jgi:hypothetical protein
MLVALILAQSANLNVQPIEVRQDGAKVPSRQRQYIVDCRTNMTCAVDGGILFLSSSGSSGGGYDGGKVAEAYAADASIYANQLLVDPTACAAGQYVSDVAADGTLTCSQPTYFDGGGLYWYDGGQGYIFAQPPLRNPDGGIALVASQDFAGHRIVLGVDNASLNSLARASMGFYAGGTLRGEVYSSPQTSGGRYQGLNINSNSGANINFSYGDPSIATCGGGGACSYGQFNSSALGFVSQTPSGSAAWANAFTGAWIDVGAGSVDYLYSDGGAIITHGILASGSYMRPGQFATGSLPTGLSGAIAYDTTDSVPKFHNGSAWSRFDAFKVATAYAADASTFALQLLNNPTDCGPSEFATGIDVSGNLTCSIPAGVGGKVAEAYMADASITAQALEANPAPCSAGQFVTDIAANGTLTCGTPAGTGSVNFVETQTALTDPGWYQQVVTGQTWVTAASKVVCGVLGTVDAGLTPEAIGIANLQVTVSDLVPSTGFTVNVASPYGLSGTISIHCTGGS